MNHHGDEQSSVVYMWRAHYFILSHGVPGRPVNYVVQSVPNPDEIFSKNVTYIAVPPIMSTLWLADRKSSRLYSDHCTGAATCCPVLILLVSGPKFTIRFIAKFVFTVYTLQMDV